MWVSEIGGERMGEELGKGLTLQAVCGPALSFGVPKLRRSRWCRGCLGWSGRKTMRDRVAMRVGSMGGFGS
jgi:hypothetical protein